MKDLGRNDWIARTTVGLALGLALMLGKPYAADAPKNFKPEDFEGPVFLLQKGANGYYAIAEAEKLPLSSKWQTRTDAGVTGKSGCTSSNAVGSVDKDVANYTGSGYMKWTGSTLGSGHSQEEDKNQTLQGSKNDWMVMKIWVESDQAGSYKATPRVYHLEQDGDNDWWHGYIGMTGTIRRGANCRAKQYSYASWGGSNILSVSLKTGLNAVYFAGRSKGIGIDRIVVTNMGAGSDAYAPTKPQSPTKGSSTQVDVGRSMSRVEIPAFPVQPDDVIVARDLGGRELGRFSGADREGLEALLHRENGELVMLTALRKGRIVSHKLGLRMVQ